MNQLRSWHWSALKVISEPMLALARTSERECRTRTTNEHYTAIESRTRTKYAYDDRGRLSQKGSLILYAHDLAGNLTQTELQNGGLTVNYTYDALNRLSTVQETNTGTTNYAYDNVGNLQSVAYTNGVAHAYSYDTRNRLSNLGVTGTVNGTPGPIASYAYTLDSSGHRTAVAELSGRTVNYGYDNLYRLTTETIAADPSAINGAVSYVYDPVGNRTQKVSTLPGYPGGLLNYNANDQLTTDGYDANGNTVGSGANTGSNGYIYDFENHLLQQGAISFTYDGDGNRVSKTVAGITTTYLVDTQNPTGYAQVLTERFNVTGPGEVLHTYVYGLERISENRQYFTGQQTLSQTFYFDYDGHGSVRALTDPTGAVTDTYDYDAFGNLIHSTGSTPNNYLFAGEQFDPDLNLYNNRARYLNTSTGRFWSMDTDEGDDTDPLSLHKYLYTEGDPVDGVDPSGNDDLAEITAGFSVSETLDAMPQLQAVNLTGKLGIGIEPPDPSAIKDGVLNVAVDPGHTFVYLKQLGSVTSILSYGPGEPIGTSNKSQFLKGTLKGNAHWPLSGSANTWKFPITAAQMNTAKQAITVFKSNVPNYTPQFQCAAGALSIAAKADVSLPSGVGPVIAREYGITFWSGNVANPYHLNQQMTAAHGAPVVVNTNSFPTP
jgi:RHS repeat-associated protein